MPTFTNYDGSLATRLDEYRGVAQKEASKHRPPPDAASPDQYESALKSEAERWLSSEQHLFDATLTEASRSATEARQKAIELSTTFDQLLSDDSTTASVEAELAGDRPALVAATEARLRAEADIKYFKACNNIHEEARYPESVLWHLGVIAILGLLEVVVNAFFYENSEGLLGGVFVAAGIATVNMCSALLLGLAFRYKNLSATDKRLCGWAALVVFILTAVFFNALFASFRSEYQLVQDPSEPAQVTAAFQRAWPEAMQIFRVNMKFKDLWSFVLFGLGMLMSITAFWKGYTLDDKHPEYGRKDRDYKKALALELQQQERVRQKVKELLHYRKAAVQAAMHEPATQVGMLARRIADLKHANSTLEAQSSAILRDYRLVIEAYRHANTAVRALPPPAYFKERPSLSLDTDGAGSDAVVQELTSVQIELKTLGDNHRDALTEKLKILQGDSTDILKTLLGVYLDDVRKEAEDHISRTVHAIHRIQPA